MQDFGNGPLELIFWVYLILDYSMWSRLGDWLLSFKFSFFTLILIYTYASCLSSVSALVSLKIILLALMIQLEAMGFDRATVLEVFFACNKDEEVAANYLLDHMHEFEDWFSWSGWSLPSVRSFENVHFFFYLFSPFLFFSSPFSLTSFVNQVWRLQQWSVWSGQVMQNVIFFSFFLVGLCKYLYA